MSSFRGSKFTSISRYDWWFIWYCFGWDCEWLIQNRGDWILKSRLARFSRCTTCDTKL